MAKGDQDMTPHVVERCAEQGELRLMRVDALPEGLTELGGNGPLVVGHSETGHHHVVDRLQARMFEADEFTCYLQVTGEYADLVHQRSFDTHRPLRLPKGTWKVRRQREWTPEGWRRAID